MSQRWDIFCSVVDNYGDAGVCWRLARQLVAEYGLSVRLWIDDLRPLHRLWPEVALDREEQCREGVEIRRWSQPFSPTTPGDVVIEAFACELPSGYVAAMAARSKPPLWLNLEYLSAESWVAGCHGLASPQAHATLRKYFFFPGFGAGTGGLLAERDLSQHRRAFQAGAHARRDFLQGIGAYGGEDYGQRDGEYLVSLFAYEHAPFAELLGGFAAGDAPVRCLVPAGRSLTAAAQFFGESTLAIGESRRRGALELIALPFLRQDDYDRLLWCCDLNCVRGEDSFVRAQWAGRPLLWHIYPQPDGAHRAKLDAFLALYRQVLPAEAAAALGECWRGWNGDGDFGAAWRALRPQLPALRQGAEAWAEQLDHGTNLAAALVLFCANQV